MTLQGGLGVENVHCLVVAIGGRHRGNNKRKKKERKKEEFTQVPGRTRNSHNSDDLKSMGLLVVKSAPSNCGHLVRFQFGGAPYE